MASEPLEQLEMSTPASTTTGEWLRDNRARLLKFGLVGASGVVVNLIVFNLAFYFLSVPWLSDAFLFPLANSLGFLVSVFTNFLFNDSWTWGDRRKGRGRQWLHRLTKYYLTASGAGLVQIVTASLSLTFIWNALNLNLGGLELTPSLAVLTGIAFGMFINFTASHLWAFRDAPTRSKP